MINDLYTSFVLYSIMETIVSNEHIKQQFVDLRHLIIDSDFTKDSVINDISNLFRCIVKQVASLSIDIKNLFYFVAYMRDIHGGLGIRTMSYHFIIILYNSFPVFTQDFIKTIVVGKHNIGSWRDVVGICEIGYKQNIDHPIISFLVSFLTQSLIQERNYFEKHGGCESNLVKWIPRERSKNKWLFRILSLKWCEIHHPHLFKHCISDVSQMRAERKCFMLYRKVVSKLSVVLSESSEYIPIHSLLKNWYSIHNITRDYQIRNSSIPSNSLSKYCIKRDISYKGRPFFMNYFHFPQGIDRMTSIMFRCIYLFTQNQETDPVASFIYYKNMSDIMNDINHLWENAFQKWNQVISVDHNSIPVIDIKTTSLSDPILHRAISRACFIAKGSNIKRILFSAHVPIWINIENTHDLSSIILCIFNCLSREPLVNTGIDKSIQFLGINHPFTLIVINNNGFCYNYKHISSYKDCSSIFQNDRYRLLDYFFC